MVNKLSFYTALMLCIPLFVWATGWHWVNDAHLISGFDTFMYFLTESGSAPYALITCVVFMLWLPAETFKCSQDAKLELKCDIKQLQKMYLQSRALMWCK